MTWKFTRIFCGIYKNTGARINRRSGARSPQAHQARAPLAAPSTLVGPSELRRLQLQLYLVPFAQKKNQREEFIAFYDTEAPPPPILPLEGRSGVRSGLRRGEIIAIVITNLPSWANSMMLFTVRE